MVALDGHGQRRPVESTYTYRTKMDSENCVRTERNGIGGRVSRSGPDHTRGARHQADTHMIHEKMLTECTWVPAAWFQRAVVAERLTRSAADPFNSKFQLAGKKLETKYQQKPKKQQALRPLTGNSGEIDFPCKLGGGEERNGR